MKAEEATRILEFVKEHGGLVEKPTRSEVRKHGIVALILLMFTAFFVYMTWVSWAKDWDTLVGVFGALVFAFGIGFLKQLIVYSDLKDKSQMSYAELISEERRRQEERKRESGIVEEGAPPDENWFDDYYFDPSNPGGLYRLLEDE